MSLHYTADQLLHLRESPLIRKPDGLPPPEQWMGYDIHRRACEGYADALHSSPVEKATAKPVMARSKTEDGQSSVPSRRSGQFEGRHTSRGSNTGSKKTKQRSLAISADQVSPHSRG